MNSEKLYGNTILQEAVHGRCSNETLQCIIQQGVTVNSVNNMSETALLYACASKQDESVKLLLENLADPNISDAESCTSLHAVVHGRCKNESVQELIAHGVYLNAQNIAGKTALWLACSIKQQDYVKILLEAGSNPNIACNKGDTSLHAAVIAGCRKKIIRTVIDYGADVNITNKENETALTIACGNQSEGALDALLKAKANPNIADANGDRCIHKAVKHDCSKEVLQAIINHGADLNATNKENTTALTIASAKRNADTINVLLNAGADPNIVAADGNTGIHHAVRGDYSNEVLQALIDHGAEVNSINGETKTALMIACEEGNMGAINVLLNAGADPDTADAGCGETCLHYAVAGDCRKEALEKIISHSADVNATNKNNVTSLMIACRKGNIDVINVLLNAGADTDIADAYGYTWLHFAVEGGCSKQVLHAILGHGADVNATNKYNETALKTACEKGNEDIINVLLNAGADPNIVDDGGFTGIHHATSGKCSKEIFQAIIDNGDVNATSKENTTALMIACEKGNEGATDVLLKAGADPNIADGDGNTWIYYAVAGNCRKGLLQAILDHGSDVNAINTNNVTPLMVACKKGNVDAINVLLKSGADPNMIDKSGATWTNHAIDGDHSIETLQAVLAHVGDAYATDNHNFIDIMLARKNGSGNAIIGLLKTGTDPNVADYEGDTCLHNAVLKLCSREALQAIIDLGVDVNITNKHNQTALILAIMIRNEDAMTVLLDAGADLNIADLNGDTCLHAAAFGGCSKEAIQTMIIHGANMNAINNHNQTALILACVMENLDAIDVFLNTGANPNIATADGNTCLHYAILEECSIECLETILVHGADVNATNTYMLTPLMLVTMENVETINLLLNAGADPNIANADGDTWLHYAVNGDCNQEILQAIIDHGADVNATNKSNITAAMIACHKRKLVLMGLCLNAGADPNSTDDEGDTLLHNAIYQNFTKETLQVIIDHGADVNATNKKHVTALMLSCYKGNTDAVSALLNAGAEYDITDAKGHTCLHAAVRGNYRKEILQAIIDHGSVVNVTNKQNQTALAIACDKGNVDAINVLLDAGADPNIADVNGDTLLHNAVQKHMDKHTLKAIIDHGVGVNAVNNEGINALLLACNTEQKESVHLLLKAGADTPIADVHAGTFLHQLLCIECDQETLQLHPDHGTPLHDANKNNQTAYKLACNQDNVGAMHALVNTGSDPNMDGDDDTHLCCGGCCSCLTLQAIAQWMNPT